MIEKVFIVFIIIVVTNGCSSPPATNSEPPCTRVSDSPYNYKGKIFTIENNNDRYHSSSYRYNKAMWAGHNRFVPIEKLESKKATVVCHEVVSGPSGVNQHVVALAVEGITEIIYTSSANVVSALSREESSTKLQEVFTAFKSLIGNKIWSKPDYSVRIDLADGLSNSIILRNLEELTIHDVIVHKKEGVGSYINSYVQVFLKRKNSDIVHVSYLVKSGVSGFIMDWHTSNPRDIYKSWSPEIWEQIEQGQVSIGMTSSMVTLAIGGPSDINTTETLHGIRSQWVYKSFTGKLNFYYFSNGVLEAIQD